MKHKHKVVVELTFDKPVTAKEAKFAVADVVEELKGANPSPRHPDARVVAIRAKEGDRVLTAVYGEGYLEGRDDNLHVEEMRRQRAEEREAMRQATVDMLYRAEGWTREERLAKNRERLARLDAGEDDA